MVVRLVSCGVREYKQAAIKMDKTETETDTETDRDRHHAQTRKGRKNNRTEYVHLCCAPQLIGCHTSTSTSASPCRGGGILVPLEHFCIIIIPAVEAGEEAGECTPLPQAVYVPGLGHTAAAAAAA
jgi:hypothetical protein